MQETIKFYLTPEGVPTDAPKNITWRFQTPDVVEIVYDAPPGALLMAAVVMMRRRIELGKGRRQKNPVFF